MGEGRDLVEGAEPDVEAFLLAATRWQQGHPVLSLTTAFAFTSGEAKTWDGLSSVKYTFKELTDPALC